MFKLTSLCGVCGRVWGCRGGVEVCGACVCMCVRVPMHAHLRSHFYSQTTTDSILPASMGGCSAMPALSTATSGGILQKSWWCQNCAVGWHRFTFLYVLGQHLFFLSSVLVLLFSCCPWWLTASKPMFVAGFFQTSSLQIMTQSLTIMKARS